MKKVNFKAVIVALSFAMAFLFLGIQRVEAQSATVSSSLSSPTSHGKGVYSAPQGSFVSSQEAENLLFNAMVSLKAQMESLVPGSAAYNATDRLKNYYFAIYSNVKGGMMVPTAISQGLTIFASDVDGTSQTDLQTMKGEAVALLDN